MLKSYNKEWAKVYKKNKIVIIKKLILVQLYLCNLN